MLVVFFGLGVAAASILGGLGRVLDASKPHLPMNVDVSKHASQKRSPCNKTTVFAMFYRLRNMPHTATKHVSCVAFKAFLDMVHELLQKFLAGIHFLLFVSTMQRGGTCAAHGIGAKLGPVGSKIAILASFGCSGAPLERILVPKSLQNGSKGAPRRLQEWIFGSFFVHFNVDIAYIYQQNSR